MNLLTESLGTGRFGEFGGQYVPETLMPALQQLTDVYVKLRSDENFQLELRNHLQDYVGRPTPLYFAKRLTDICKGAQIYLKREDLNHTGAHKINNAVGQALIAKAMGKSKVIAETGAGQHGVATATVAAKFGLQCTVFMGELDIRRQALNVYRMRMLGADVRAVTSGSQTLKDATNEALRHWVANVEDTHYIIGSVVGPHPYPTIVRDLQRVIGEETRQQIQASSGRLPDAIVASVGGGSNAIGMFHAFLGDSQVALFGVEAAGLGLATMHHAATLTMGSRGVLHGAMTMLLQDEYGQIQEAHSISAGLDYPGVGPEHAALHASGRVKYESVTDAEALNAFHQLSQLEGIIPALESAHALAFAMRMAAHMDEQQIIVVNLSGRGDKDVEEILRRQGGDTGESH